LREDAWVLDALGNPNCKLVTPSGFTQSGRITTGDLDAFATPWAAVLAAPADGSDDAAQTTLQTDRRNRLTSFARVTDLPADAGGLGTTAPFVRQDPQYDAAGNVVNDGTYVYQYDAWNRLVRVNRPAAAQPFPDGAAAMVIASAGASLSVTPGALVKHFKQRRRKHQHRQL
jgi:YD repeat-containing protein